MSDPSPPAQASKPTQAAPTGSAATHISSPAPGSGGQTSAKSATQQPSNQVSMPLNLNYMPHHRTVNPFASQAPGSGLTLAGQGRTLRPCPCFAACPDA